MYNLFVTAQSGACLKHYLTVSKTDCT